MGLKIKYRVYGLLAIKAIFILDQLSKYLILQQPQLSEHTVMEVTTFFNLALVFNRGVSFGMFSGQNQPILLTTISLIIIAILFRWLWKNDSLMVALGIGCVIGGAIGNVVDRVRYGAVVDFLDFHIGNLHWPAFNIADSFVFIGVVVLCVYSMFFEQKKLSEANRSTEQ